MLKIVIFILHLIFNEYSLNVYSIQVILGTQEGLENHSQILSHVFKLILLSVDLSISHKPSSL